MCKRKWKQFREVHIIQKNGKRLCAVRAVFNDVLGKTDKG